LKKYNPYRNIFYYFRGANNSDKSTDKQIEDNTTKSLINTLEYSNRLLLNYFLDNLSLSFNKNDSAKYDLQVAELLSRPDAQIRIGKVDYYIESKVQAPLEELQIINHLKSIGKSNLIIITPRETDKKILAKIQNPQIRFITWEKIYILFSDYLNRQKDEEYNFILVQFLKYLESINMAPFKGFRKEDFDSFLNIEDDPKKELRTIVKNKFRKYLEELKDEIKSIPAYAGLKIEVGNLHTNDHYIWGTLSQNLKEKVNVPHFNFVLSRNTFSIGFIVEGKVPADKFYRHINNHADSFLKLLNNLPEFHFELQERKYIRPRIYKNIQVSSIKCGKDIKLEDIEYIWKKVNQYPLILTWCHITFERDDTVLNSRKFIKTSLEYLNLLKPLYEFSKS